jgi:hypothetical protein
METKSFQNIVYILMLYNQLIIIKLRLFKRPQFFTEATKVSD